MKVAPPRSRAVRTEFLPFCRPQISEEEIAEVGELLRSGWITTGAKAAEFEEKIGEYVGAAGSVAVCSATGGMHVVLAALGIGPGDEVITPSMTWVSTVNLIVLAGATPVFADVDRETLLVTADSIAACITDRTRLIVPVHFAGSAVEMEPIRALAAERGIAVVEDAAHAIGTCVGDSRIGGQGTAIFSFHPIKTMTTGEGGMVCSDDSALLDRVRRLKFHGLGADAWDRTTQGRTPQAQVVEPGYKYNLTDIAAVLGLGQLARLDRFIEQRKAIAAIYDARFANVDGIAPLATPASTTRHSRSLYIVRVLPDRCGLNRDELLARLKARNIGSGIHFLAVHRQAYYRERADLRRVELPNTEWNSDRILSLPLFPGMTFDDAHQVVDAIEAEIRS